MTAPALIEPRLRARIVEAADAERQRLERNLHDGAQQRLVSLGLRLSLLAKNLDPDSEASLLLAQARASSPTRFRSYASWPAAFIPRHSAAAGSSPPSNRSPGARRCRCA